MPSWTACERVIVIVIAIVKCGYAREFVVECEVRNREKVQSYTLRPTDTVPDRVMTVTYRSTYWCKADTGTFK